MKSKTGIRAVLVGLLALVGVAGAAATADATTPGTNSKIAASQAASSPLPGTLSSPLPGTLLFTHSARHDVQTIFLATGRRVRRLTRPGAYCCLVRISPDHRRVLVMPGGNIAPPVTGGTINLAGVGFQRLPLADPKLNLVPQAWSPDGTRIAFEGWDDSDPSRAGVYITNAADGTNAVRVTTRPGLHHDIPLDYSPDGTRLVVYRSVRVDPDPYAYVGGSLWVVNVDGSGLHEIAGASVRPAAWARWSRNGRTILFANERTAPSGAIWTVRPDGTNLAKVFADRRGRFPIQPVWSPDGSRILFALDPTNDQFTHPFNGLYLIRADGSHLQLLIGGNSFKSQPEWWR